MSKDSNLVKIRNMPINIQISERDIPLLIKVYTDKKNKLLEELKTVDAFLLQLNEGKRKKDSLDIGTLTQPHKKYNLDWTWVDKIEYILQEANKALTTSEIVTRVIRLDPKLEGHERKVLGSISAVLSAKSKPGGRFKRGENERGALVFWLDK